MPGKEKRKHQRLHASHLVTYTKFTPEDVPELMGMGNTVDVSESGVKLTTKEPLDVGDVFKLTFNVRGEMVKADARVVHVEIVKHYQIGLYFEDLGEADQKRLRDYIAANGFKDTSADRA